MGIDFFEPSGTFRTRLLGFDKAEVLACLRNLKIDQEDARRQIEQLTSTLRASEASRPPVLVERDSKGSVQAIERLLASAQRVAHDVRAEAEVAARQILRQAQEEAAQLRSEAAADASALASTATARIAELEAEIVRMTERRDAIQVMLERAADRMNEIAGQMRVWVFSPGKTEQEETEKIDRPEEPSAPDATVPARI